MKARYEKGQPLKPTRCCIKTWKVSMKPGKVHGDAFMDGIIGGWTLGHTDSLRGERTFFQHYVKIKAEKSQLIM